MASELPIHRLLPTVTCSACRVRMAPVVVDSLPADRIDVTSATGAARRLGA
jgi:hypothetical protein